VIPREGVERLQERYQRALDLVEVIPREGVERGLFGPSRTLTAPFVIPREGVERNVTDIVIHACAVTRTI
jgi:hypothetical protein